MKLPVDYTKISQPERRKVREAYIELQGRKCHHCGESLQELPTKSVLRKKIKTSLFPSGFFDYPVHLHHNHNTGMTIGAVHSLCNAVLWQYYGE